LALAVWRLSAYRSPEPLAQIAVTVRVPLNEPSLSATAPYENGAAYVEMRTSIESSNADPPTVQVPGGQFAVALATAQDAPPNVQ
jgi:hypothetical protein